MMLMNTNDASKENVYASICKKAREENAKQRVSIDTQILQPNKEELAEWQKFRNAVST